MKGIITIIIIIIIFVVGFLILRDDTPQDTTANEVKQTQTAEGSNISSDTIVEVEDTVIETTPEVIVVTYNDEGFTPKNISIVQGQTVRFINKSSGNMWVASDNHPTHRIMPEFDEKKAVGNSESYEFTFTKTGEWTYHNHIKPNTIGTIIVK